MENHALESFINNVKRDWSGLNTETVDAVRDHLIELTHQAGEEPWLASIKREKPASSELYRDLEYGYILLAHTEKKGLYRAPHNHGNGWVFYALQSGKMEMTSYKQITTHTDDIKLVSRGKEVLQKGDCRVLLPGDIHDTKCLSNDLIQYRLTSWDLTKEKKARRMVQYSKSATLQR